MRKRIKGVILWIGVILVLGSGCETTKRLGQGIVAGIVGLYSVTKSVGEGAVKDSISFATLLQNSVQKTDAWIEEKLW